MNQTWPTAEVLCIGEPLVMLNPIDADGKKAFTPSVTGDVFNTAKTLRQLKQRVTILTRLGTDSFSQQVKTSCQVQGIQLQARTSSDRPCALIQRRAEIDGAKRFTYWRQGSAASTLSAYDITLELVERHSIVYATGITAALSHTSFETVLKAFQLAKQLSKTTVFDCNYRPTLWASSQQASDAYHALLPYVDVVLPSWPDDSTDLFGNLTPEQLAIYLQAKGPTLCVVKQGEKPVLLAFQHEQDRIHVPTITGSFDAMGAGDRFAGGFMAGLLEQQPLKRCVELAIQSAQQDAFLVAG